MRRIAKIGCSIAQTRVRGEANIGCGVAQIEVRRPDVRQARSGTLQEIPLMSISCEDTGVDLNNCDICINDDLFNRLEIVRFFHLFTGEGDMENTGRGNTEPRGLKARVLP